MDVTFTNVLEGARQYFQGLPATTASTAYSSNNENNFNRNNVADQQVQERPSNNVSYWPHQQHQPQDSHHNHDRSQVQVDAMHRVPSNHSESAHPSTQQQHQQQELRQCATNYNLQQSQHEQLNSQIMSYNNYSRSHSREISSNGNQQVQMQHNNGQNQQTYNQQLQHQQRSHQLQQQQQQKQNLHQQQLRQQNSQQPQHYQQQSAQHLNQQYQQSHIMPNPAYHPSSSQQRSSSARNQERITTPSSNSSQTYHQLQNSVSNNVHYPSSSRSHYPVQSQSQVQNHPSSSSSYAYQAQPMYTSYSQTTNTNMYSSNANNCLQTQNYCSNPKSTSNTQSYNSNCESTENHQYVTGSSSQNSTTLQPHKSVRSVINRNQTAATPYSNNVMSTTNSQNNEPNNNQFQHNQSNRSSVQNYHYGTTVASQSSYTTTTSTNSTSKNVYQMRNSNIQQHHNQQMYSTSKVTPTVQPTLANNYQGNNLTSVIKQKRESPLDLSVKTVKSSADSTLDDLENMETQRMPKYPQDGRPMMYSINQPSYSNFPNHETNQNIVASGTSKTVSSNVGAPKVDFLPNFNMRVPCNNNKLTSPKVSQQTSLYNHTTQQLQYDRNKSYMNNSHVVNHNITNVNKNVSPEAHVSVAVGSYPAQKASKKLSQTLPRVDFPPVNHKIDMNASYPSKRRTEMPSAVPNKMAKVDYWRQAIDQQIEQRISSYTKLKEQDKQDHIIPNVNHSARKNVYTSACQERSKELYGLNNIRSSYDPIENQVFSNNTQYNQHTTVNHNQTYVPSAVAHHYPGYNNVRPQNNKVVEPLFNLNSLTRSNSSSSLAPNSSLKNNSGADKRIISLLRNSLESKGAKEAQKKLEREQVRSADISYSNRQRTDVQHPSTDVTAPLQPKLSLGGGRQNVSPFAATSLHERNTNTPTAYKFHLPKAIESVKFESDITKEENISPTSRTNSINMSEDMQPSISNNSNSNSDYDGLAAFLAARIRTKAELKQVGTAQYLFNSNSTTVMENSDSVKQMLDFQNPLCNGTNNLQKHVLDNSQYQPRKRLFSRSEDDTNKPFGSSVPRIDKTGMRSSSETSVFDFPDTDSEGEMPVLERQTLTDLRKERRNSVKDRSEECLKVESTSDTLRADSPFDSLFNDACDKFVEELKTGSGKKRGRRKKVVEPEVIAKLEETVIKETPVEVITLKKEHEELIEEKVVVKQEPESNEDATIETEPAIKIEPEINELDTALKISLPSIKIESDSDSDAPLIDCKTKAKSISTKTENKKCPENKIIENVSPLKNDKKIKNVGDSSDSEEEPVKQSPRKGRTPKNSPSKQKVTEKESDGVIKKVTTIARHTKKPAFGDGTDFYPGWEEAVFKYKKSLRMPSGLIPITRPPQWPRLSTSLPDLDPYPNSPCTSTTTVENNESKKIKAEVVDSDMDSNSSYSFTFSKNNNYDSEGSSSVTSMPTPKWNNSILDRLIQKYGTRKRRKRSKKKEEDNGPKIIPKAEDPLELLPTPGLEITTCKSKKVEPVIKSDSVFLGFRKKTVDNFKNAFIKNSNNLVGVNEQFKTVILKSRTRKQTRVLKQKATIREVFGEERPASAPPVTCINNCGEEQKDANDKTNVNVKTENKVSSSKQTTDTVPSEKTKQVLKGKLLKKRKLSGSLDLLENPNTNIKKEIDTKSETLSVEDDCISVKSNDTSSTTHSKRRFKNMRRKFSSGFDYIKKYKKKKQIKKEVQVGDGTGTPVKSRKKGFFSKASPESIQDIQKEIKTWVMNKGIGETHLHRAARLGYTDITAYCLEKMDSLPSPKDNAGYTPLHEACARGHLAIAKLLLMYGANVSDSAQGGIRPLHEATENGYVEIVRLLLSYGADPALATYSGLTPLSLTNDETTMFVLQNHIADIRGDPAPPWTFCGPASCFDPPDDELGFNILNDVPNADQQSNEIEDEEIIEFEVSEFPLPNLYTLRSESSADQWILLQDLSNILKIKSRDALLKQITGCSSSPSSPSLNNKNIIKELKTQDFLEQARCSQYLCVGEKINVRASKIALVKFTEKVKKLLNIEKVIIPER